MADNPNSIPVRCLKWLTWAVYHHRRKFVWPQVILLVLTVAYTVFNLEFDTERSTLLSPELASHRNMLAYRAEFPLQDDVVVMIESNDQEKNRQFVERLGAKLEAETNLFADVFYKGDLRMLGHKALLFLPEEKLRDLKQTLADYRPFVSMFTQVTNLNSLFRTINQQFREGLRTNAQEAGAILKAVPALQRIIDQAADSLDRPGLPPSPGVNALFGAGDEAERAMYITFGEGKIYIVTTRAHEAGQQRKLITRLRELVSETQREVPGVNAGITGEPVLEIDEMMQSQKDSTKATIISLMIVLVIFVFGYHETGRPIKATFCLLFGLGYTMAFTTAVIGHLNVLTITFAPMLIGLAIDFGVHLISRYEEELRHGRTQYEALELAMVNTGQGIFTGCFTTAGAFLAMAFTDFRGIQEMGIICGAGLIICLVPMMTLLPALLLRGRQNIIDHVAPPVSSLSQRVEGIWLNRPRTVVLVALVLCGLSFAVLGRVFFDYNLLNMQSRNLPAVLFEKKLLESSSKSLLYGAVITDSLDKAVELEAKLLKLPTVAEVQSMAGFLTQKPETKLEMIREIKQLLQGVDFAPLPPHDSNPLELNTTIEATKGYFALAIELAGKAGSTNAVEAFQRLRAGISLLQSRMEGRDRQAVAHKLGAFETALMEDIRSTFDSLRNQVDQGGLTVNDLPPWLRHRFIGVTGKYLIQVFPKEDVWDRAPQERFIRDLQTVDPNATGTPVQLYAYVSLLKDSFVQAAWYSLAAIAVLVFIHFRSVLSVILSLLPVLLGSLWTLGAMGWFGIPFNPANIMTLPLVVGIGVTNGIHILNRFREERRPSILATSTGKAVIVSALTTVAGFGSLILAEHQGIESLGWLMSLGTTASMVAALTCVPAILNLARRAPDTGKEKTQ
jgi:hopanoid biosynthesis associated RND transporter like protein HpnN